MPAWCRVIEYETRASAALQQAIAEETRVGQAQRETEVELHAVEVARASLQVRWGWSEAGAPWLWMSLCT